MSSSNVKSWIGCIREASDSGYALTPRHKPYSYGDGCLLLEKLCPLPRSLDSVKGIPSLLAKDYARASKPHARTCTICHLEGCKVEHDDYIRKFHAEKQHKALNIRVRLQYSSCMKAWHRTSSFRLELEVALVAEP